MWSYTRRLLVPPEPNLLSGTAHSVNKRGVKRRDLDVEELKEILSPLLPFVRTEHILPPHSDVLTDAVGSSGRRLLTLLLRSPASPPSSPCPQLKRGLISTPPSDMLPTAEGGKANSWLRQKNAGIYVRPRLFSPYVEEAKVRSCWFSELHGSSEAMENSVVRNEPNGFLFV